MNTPYGAALFRGIIAALIGAGATFFTTVAMTDTRTALFAAGAAAFSALAIRFGVEGTYDNNSRIQRDADAAKGGN